MNKEEIKISMPLIDDIELQRIDNFYNDIVDEYTKAYVKEKEQVITQRLMKNLREENKKLKIQISAREEEYKKLENKLTETENWLRPAILQLMDFAKQDYYWITDQQIDNAKLVSIEFLVMGDKCVKFKKNRTRCK